MTKCIGRMPECEYFTTAGCISPFNCMYKEESGYINSATSGKVFYTGGMNMTNEEMIENLKCVIADISAQCKQLESENAALRERLGKFDDLHIHMGEKVYIIADDNEIIERFICGIHILSTEIIFVTTITENYKPCKKKE